MVVALYFLFPVLQDRDQIQPLWRFLTFTLNLGDPARLARPSPTPGRSAWRSSSTSCCRWPWRCWRWRPSPAKIIGAVVGLIVFGMALRGYLWLADVAARPFDISADPHGGAYMDLIYYPTWSRLDDLLGGICAALVQVCRPAWWAALTRRGNLLTAVGVAGVTAVMWMFQDGEVAGFFPAVFGFPVLAAAMSLLVIAGASARALIGRLAIPGAGALAAGAYSLYLSHKIVFHQVGVVVADVAGGGQGLCLRGRVRRRAGRRRGAVLGGGAAVPED